MSVRAAGVLSPRPARETTLTNVRAVTPDGVLTGSVSFADGTITAIDRNNRAGGDDVLDCAGDYLLPGLIDVHTDQLEKFMMPRAGVFWHPLSAVVAYDTGLAGVGITTVFDSVCVGAMGSPDRLKLLPRMIEGVRQARQAGVLLVDHYLHLRCDVMQEDLADLFGRYANDASLKFVTIMDDSLGRDPVRFRKVLRQRGIASEETIEQLAAVAAADARDVPQRNRDWLIAQGRALGVPVANHDDTQAEHSREARERGMTISEFPITLDAARAARAAGLTIISGAPNVLNGGSHAGNVPVRTLREEGMLDVLCSDYVPSSLLPAVFALATDRGDDLARTVRMATQTPAQVFNLSDRGAIRVGARADLIRVREVDGLPVVMSVWTLGRPIVGR